MSYASTIHTSKGVVVSTPGRIDIDETGSPKSTGYHSRSHQHQQPNPEHSPHLHRHPYEHESDLVPAPNIPPPAADHRTSSHASHSAGYRTKSRGKKHKKQAPSNIAATIPTVISSVESPQSQSILSSYPAGIEIHHQSDYLVDSCVAQSSLTTDAVVPTYTEISSVVVDTSPVIISTIDDVEIVPPPPLPNDDESEMQFLQQHHTKEPLVEPPSFFGVPNLTSNPRKWSIASGDKPVDPKLMAGEMIDVVRSATGLSHKKCQMAAQVVLGYIQVKWYF